MFLADLERLDRLAELARRFEVAGDGIDPVAALRGRIRELLVAGSVAGKVGLEGWQRLDHFARLGAVSPSTERDLERLLGGLGRSSRQSSAPRRPPLTYAAFFCSDGSRFQRHPDGSRFQRHPDGSRSQRRGRPDPWIPTLLAAAAGDGGTADDVPITGIGQLWDLLDAELNEVDRLLGKEFDLGVVWAGEMVYDRAIGHHSLWSEGGEPFVVEMGTWLQHFKAWIDACMDRKLKGSTGLDAFRRLRGRFPKLPDAAEEELDLGTIEIPDVSASGLIGSDPAGLPSHPGAAPEAPYTTAPTPGVSPAPAAPSPPLPVSPPPASPASAADHQRRTAPPTVKVVDWQAKKGVGTAQVLEGLLLWLAEAPTGGIIKLQVGMDQVHLMQFAHKLLGDLERSEEDWPQRLEGKSFLIQSPSSGWQARFHTTSKHRVAPDGTPLPPVPEISYVMEQIHH